MSLSDNSLVLMTLSSESRSVSPMTPSPSREMRGIRLFRAISRKLARHRRPRRDDHFEEDSRSSSTDSCSSTSAGRRCSRSSNKKPLTEDGLSSAESGFRSVSPHHMSSSSSEAGSDSSKRHHHSTSAESIRKAFLNLSLAAGGGGGGGGARSKSCSAGKENSKRSKEPPKRILRPPVSYTYAKGLSGLPTQRIPKNLPKVYMNSSACGCSMQYVAAMNR